MGNRPTINISNASSHNVHVKVLCDIEYRNVVSVGVDANAGVLGGLGVQVNKENNWRRIEKVGYTLVNRYSSMKFHPDSSKGICYVTVRINPEENEGRLCTNHPLGVKKGLIIDRYCYVHTAKKGKNGLTLMEVIINQTYLTGITFRKMFHVLLL